MSTSRRRFTQEFKDELCREVISTSKPIKDVAVAYGVGPDEDNELVYDADGQPTQFRTVPSVFLWPNES